jgi:phosphohistidine phosphatase
VEQPVWDIEPEPTRRLVVVRHARAEAFADSDRLRQLTPAGTADAHALAAWLMSVGVRPDRALVSTAVRTRQTWDALMEVTGWGVAPHFDDSVYAGAPDTLLDEIRSTDPESRTVLLLGHNPAMAYLAQILPDGEGDLEIELAMAAGFPTSSAAVFGVNGEWSELEPGTARLMEFHIGRTKS